MNQHCGTEHKGCANSETLTEEHYEEICACCGHCDWCDGATDPRDHAYGVCMRVKPCVHSTRTGGPKCGREGTRFRVLVSNRVQWVCDEHQDPAFKLPRKAQTQPKVEPVEVEIRVKAGPRSRAQRWHERIMNAYTPETLVTHKATASEAVAYREYVSEGLGDTDGYFAPVDQGAFVSQLRRSLSL